MPVRPSSHCKSHHRHSPVCSPADPFREWRQTTDRIAAIHEGDKSIAALKARERSLSERDIASARYPPSRSAAAYCIARMGLPMQSSRPLASAADRCRGQPLRSGQGTYIRLHNQRLNESSLLSSRLWLAPWMPISRGSRSVGNSGFASQATSVSAAPSFTRDVPQFHFLDTFGVSSDELIPEAELLQPQHHHSAQPAVAITPDPPPAITIRFEVPEFVTAPGERLVICGSVPALGSWELESSRGCLTWSKGHRWTGEIELEPGWHGALEFKVALVNHNTHIWEPGSNRLLVVERPRSGKQRRLDGVHQTSVDDLDASEVQGPVLQVQCEWGKAEAPNAPLPPSLLCSASTPGRLANGQALGVAGELSQAQATLLAGSTRRDESALVMANCQVVVPWLEPRLAAGAVAETSGAEGLHLILVGSVPGLGCWDPAQGLRLAADDAGMWRGRLELPMGYSVQAKLALWDSVKGVVRAWEPGGNRTFRLPEAPASMSGRQDEPHASGSPAPDGGPGSSRSMTQGNGVQRTMSRVGPWPVMPDGEFMLLTHWGTPGFPHLVFLPSIDSLPSSVSQSNKRPSTVMCRFTVPHLPTSPNQHLLLVGSTPKLGNWDPTRGLRLQWGPGHSWQAGVHLPAEDETVEAKVVLWDGAAYRWEPGPNRRMRPGQLIADVAPTGAWGEVLHILYWGGTQEAGRTPAVVIPQDALLASVGPGSESATASSSGSNGSFSRRSSDSGAPGHNGSAAGGTNNGPVEPGLMMLQLMASLAAMALHAGETGTLAAAGEPLGSTPLWVGVGAGPHRVSGASLVVSSLEATAEALRAQLAETHAARQRDVDSLRQQVAEANKALAMEEDEVESLHCQLGSRTAELRNLQQQLARAEATAAAAVAAATTALSSASSMYAAANNGSTSVSSGESSGRNGAADPSGGNLPGVAAATFQKLTEQLAVLQLEADMARRALTEAHAARSSEVAHLRSELSEAVAWRHKDAEAARLATSALTLAHQQEVARLHSALADTQRARQRDMTALQARLEAVAAASAGETSRLVRQLAQACAAAEALETQLMRQSSHTASGGTEMRRLRGLLSSQASELESLKGQLADGHAAAAVGLFSPAAPLVGAPDQDGTSPADLLLIGSNQADMLLEQSSHDLASEPTASDVLPGQLASVMTEVRAAKAALEQLSSSGQSFVNSVTASVGIAAVNGTAMANGVEESSSSNGTSVHRVNGNGHLLNGHHLNGTWGKGTIPTGPSNNITVFLHQQHKKRGNGAERSHSVEPDSDNEKE